MKYIQKHLVILFFVYWIGYVVFYLIFRVITLDAHQVINGILLGFFLASLFTGAIYGGLYFSVVPKMKYIESRDLKIPNYFDTQERTIIPQKDDFSFAEIQERISRKWILTYVDDELNVMKFRSRDAFLFLGIGSYLAYDDVCKTISIASFPFSAYAQKGGRLNTELNNQIEALKVLN
jgi:hypothetical protein